MLYTTTICCGSKRTGLKHAALDVCLQAAMLVRNTCFKSYSRQARKESSRLVGRSLFGLPKTAMSVSSGEGGGVGRQLIIVVANESQDWSS